MLFQEGEHADATKAMLRSEFPGAEVGKHNGNATANGFRTVKDGLLAAREGSEIMRRQMLEKIVIVLGPKYRLLSPLLVEPRIQSSHTKAELHKIISAETA